MITKLKEIVKHAYENVPYYKKADKPVESVPFEKQWSSIPILTKNQVIKNQNVLISNQSIVKYTNNQLHMEHTSGSTGKCLEVFWEKSDYQRSLMPLYIGRRKYYGIIPDDKLCFFYTVRSSDSKDVGYIETNRTLSFSKSNLNNKKLRDIYNRMKIFEPIWIIGQPSILLLLSNIIIDNQFEPISSIKYIELTGEMLFPAIRERIERAFECSIANHYGTIEVSSIAYECPCGNMHLTDCTYTEIVDSAGNILSDGQEGEVCVTSLVNTAMPLIRYNVGDRAIIHDSKICACGSKNKVLELTTGRTNDYILTHEGEHINSYIFVRAVQIVNSKYHQSIKQFQVTQLDYLKFSVTFVLDEDYETESIYDLFVNSIWQDELREAVYVFKIVDELFPNANGKLSYFVNQVKD